MQLLLMPYFAVQNKVKKPFLDHADTDQSQDLINCFLFQGLSLRKHEDSKKKIKKSFVTDKPTNLTNQPKTTAKHNLLGVFKSVYVASAVINNTTRSLQ